VPTTPELRRRIGEAAPDVRRKLGWEITSEIEAQARDAGAAGVVLMGLKFESLVEEAATQWRPVTDT
jgi:hypothetical protein